MFETLDPSNPECEVSQVDVEEWIDAGKGIVVAHTIVDGVLINAVYEPRLKVKFLFTSFQTKKSSQRTCVGLKLPTHILHFCSVLKAGHVIWHRK